MVEDPLLKLLVQAGLDRQAIAQADAKATKHKTSLMYALEKLKLLNEDQILDVFSKYYGVPKVKINDMDIPPNLIALIPKDIAVRYRIVPIDRVGNHLIIAMANPKNLSTLDAIRFKTGYTAKAAVASEIAISEALNRYYQHVLEVNKDGDGENKEVEPLQKRQQIGHGEADNNIINLVNQILVQCLNRGASDIHIEPYEQFLRVRLRIDGVLHQIATPPLSMKAALTSRIKIMANLNIAESRLPQDGSINVQIGNKPVDFRVNTLPTLFGEKIVLRILDKSALNVDMTKLGFEVDELKKFTASTHSPFGMVLVTGPTGSGKTTTLYSALTDLNKETENIMTAEDPVEYNLPGINQVQMKSDIGLTFAAALRAFLRQDPDIIMVGEIRDHETAEIAIKAALTGHLVISTLHTNSAPETISRLMNMGVEPYNLVSALNCITAQRLLRKICQECKIVDTDVTRTVMIDLGVSEDLANGAQAYKGKGCSACGGTGTKGRIAAHEVLQMSDPVKEAILAGSSSLHLKRVAIQNGMRTLRQSALAKMLRGIVPAVEVTKVTSADSLQPSINERK